MVEVDENNGETIVLRDNQTDTVVLHMDLKRTS